MAGNPLSGLVTTAKKTFRSQTAASHVLARARAATALKLRAEQQAHDRTAANDAWQDTGLVFTTAYGTQRPAT